MAKPPEAPGTHGLSDLATLLEITPQWFLRLVAKKYIPREDRGKYNLVSAVRGYIRYLKDEERRASKSAAASRLTDQRALEVEERRQERNRTKIETDEAAAVLDDVVGIYRAAYAGLPAACTMDLALREKIEAYVNATQDRVEAELRRRLAALRSGRGAVEAEPGDDA